MPNYNDLWTISVYNHQVLKKTFEEIKLIYNPVSPLFKREKRRKHRTKVIGRISRNDIVKIDFDVIVAFIWLSWKKYKLKLVGIPQSVKYVLNFFGNRNQITFIDEITSETRLKEFYQEIDLLIHGSFAGETFGMVISEALSCGTPVIYSANLRKGLAPHELLHESALCSGFWNIIKKTDDYLARNSNYIFRMGKKDFCPDLNASSLISNTTNTNIYDYPLLNGKKRKAVFFRSYIFISNYAIILWYLSLKTFLGIER